MTALAMIVAAAERHADRIAIEDGEAGAVTYAELLARVRHAAGAIAAGSIVELDAARTIDFIVGCLAAWIAGAAWIPIDACEPAWRRAAIRADLAAAGAAGAPSADRLAYVIATSGSSGAPKLVMVAHRGLPALLCAQIAAFELAPGARALWLHAPRFDASVSDWGTALAAGATLVIPAADALAAPERLRGELARRRITHVDLPPALLAYLPPGDPPPGVRVVVLGGEPCPIEPVRALARRAKVVVVYGPTEATVCSSLVAVDPERWSRPLIGDPLPGVVYRVVDGELWIGGDCLALGYAGDPAATARAFVELDGRRMYRTGDRVEPCDGGLAFAGRIDRQRKLAGVRVELGEIEAVLRCAPGIREAAVTVSVPVTVPGAVLGTGGRARLVAYVDGDLEPGAVRAWMRREAPMWMVPSRVIVGALPHTPTGKIDHGALARRELAEPAPVGGDPVERALAALWCEALGVAEVTGERFRDAGGDSLAQLTLQAAAAARAISLDAAAFAGDPTFGELVAAVRGARTAALTVAECEARGLAALAARVDHEDNAHVGANHADREVGPTSARLALASAIDCSVDPAGGWIDPALAVDCEAGIASHHVGRARSSMIVGDGATAAAEGAIPITGATGRSGGARSSMIVEDRETAAAAGAVLITGATGRLGSALLRAWRSRDPRRIIALVRAPDPASARRRLGGDDAGVEALCGDVARPYLGLARDAWRALAGRVSAVVHAAAHIDLAAGWDAHAAANVDGTAEIARLIAARPGIAWHHISTLSVFVGTDRKTGVHREAGVPVAAAIAHGGYAQTKIAAEAIARACRGRAAPTTILRLGLLVGEAPEALEVVEVAEALEVAGAPGVSRAPRVHDQLAMTLRGLARLGAIPAGAAALRLDLTPIDHAAAAVAVLALRAERAGLDDTHHIASARAATFGELAAGLRAAGIDLVELPPAAWAERARDRLADPDVAMAYLSLGRMLDGAPPSFDLFLATGAEFDVARTARLLTEHGVVAPAIEPGLIARVVAAALAAEAVA